MSNSQYEAKHWEAAAEVYKLMVNTGLPSIARMLEVTNAALPFKNATGILDNGCGPGNIMTTILKDHGTEIPTSCTLECTDLSQAMLNMAMKTKDDEVHRDPSSPWGKVSFHVSDAMDMKDVADGSQSHVMAGWVFFMAQTPLKCVTESFRMLQPGGVLCASSLKSSQWLDIMRIAEQVRPGTHLPPIAASWTDAGSLRAEFEEAGFRDVQVDEVQVKYEVTSYEVTLEVFNTKLPPVVAATKDFTEEEKAELRRRMAVELKRLVPSLPGHLTGQSLVAIGRK